MYRMGSSSNGPLSGVSEGFAGSMSGLSISSSGQSNPGGGGEAYSFLSNQGSPALSPLKKSSSGGTSSGSLAALGRTSLNPHAAEFVPKSFKPVSNSVSGNAWDTSKSNAGSAVEKDVGQSKLDRTDSSNSNISDDEYRRLFRAQLPDDLMPDFDVRDFVEGVSDYEESAYLDIAGQKGWEAGSGSTTSKSESISYEDRIRQTALRTTSFSPPRGNGSRYNNGQGSMFTGPSFVRPYLPELRSSLQQQILANQERQAPGLWTDNSETAGSFSDWGVGEQAFPDDLGEIDPINLLTAEFPGFASESLAEIYYANGGDLSLTMEMLTELENEGVSAAKQFQAPPTQTPLSPRDFPALPAFDNLNASLLSSRATGAIVGESRTTPDFVAAVRKQAAQQAAQLQYERNGGVDLSLGALRGGISQTQGVGGFLRDARGSHGERLEAYQLHAREAQAPPPPTWLDTGDSVATMYTDMREEARDHARVRNAYFDQARQAYLSGNKALAKELSAKGQWHNEQMKAAHSKAGEAIFWQRNANVYGNNSNTTGQARLLDLHGLHVNEAIPALKREIAQLRLNVRSTRQREQIFICVGTGHHTKGSRTPARLPIAVQQYLAEEEHLPFTETQPGMLRVIVR
ncbi:hypothetical protein BDL97_15G040500 [Sphagnum fallax]|nr:hypothetical protein BDL97_15G040500 [Sphagnum fallax]KAH8939510.1 hypothetical protein BDL97_15G040500 [Sphagnum fallax]KAH8939511.1 hypothetical protein BDL97_15G040500 [Sphagnum fallax]